MEEHVCVQYVGPHGTVVEGYVIDEHEGVLDGKWKFLVADRTHDDPSEDGKWVNACDCWEVEDVAHPSQQVSCFV